MVEFTVRFTYYWRKKFFITFLGNHDSRTAWLLLESIKHAVTEKITGILNACNFMSLMTDGSQAHKTGSDKELKLVHAVRHDGM